MNLFPRRINLKNLDTFSEITDAWQALFVMTRFGLDSQPKASFMVYRKFLWCVVVCVTGNMKYTRFAWFEWDRPQEKRSRNDILAIALLVAGTIFFLFFVTQASKLF